MATSLTEIIKDPNYVNANPETQRAIFEKYAPLDPNYSNANAATQEAIRSKFGVAQPSDVELFYKQLKNISGPIPTGPIASVVHGASDVARNIVLGGASLADKFFPRDQNLSGLVTGQQPSYRADAQKAFADQEAAYQKYFGETDALRPVGQIAATVPFQIGAGQAVSRFNPALGAQIQAGGFGPNGTMPTRIAGGAISGGLGAGLVNPDETTMGATLGAILPPAARPVAKVVGELGKRVSAMLPFGVKQNAYMEALGNDPQRITAAIDMLEKGIPIEQVAVNLNSSGLAALAKSTREKASSAIVDLYAARDAAMKLQQTNQLAGAQQNLNALAQQNIPAATGTPSAPRAAVKRSLAEERAALERQKAARTGVLTEEQIAAENALATKRAEEQARIEAGQGTTNAALAEREAKARAGVANVSQLTVGEELAKAEKAIQENTKETVTRPAYKAAFAAAPDATIDLSNLAAVSKGQLGDLLTEIKGLAPNAAAFLEKYGPKERTVNMGEGLTTTEMVAAKPVTLEDAHKLRQAINIDRSALKGSTDSQANITRARLSQLYSEVDKAIKAGTPEEAYKLFQEANKLFRERIVGVHGTGPIAKLSRTSTTNEPMLRPVEIVSTALKDEGATRQFLNLYSQDPAALQKLSTGIEDLYRREVLKPSAGADAHANFMFTRADQLAAMDQAGMNMTQRLNSIGDEFANIRQAKEVAKAAKGETFKAEEKALEQQRAGIPKKIDKEFADQDKALNLAATTLGFKYTPDLRAKVVTDPMTRSMALSRMDDAAKSSLARGVMLDASQGVIAGEAGAGAKMLKHLTDNEAGILKVLQASDPKNAAKILADAKQVAELYQLVEQAGNKLAPEGAALNNAMTTARNIGALTQNAPEIRAVADKILSDLAMGKKFEELGGKGVTAGTQGAKLFSDQLKPEPPGGWSPTYTIARHIYKLLGGRIDNKLAVEVATELANSQTAAEAIKAARDRTIKQEQRRAVATGVAKKSAPIYPTLVTPTNQMAE
jgi:hypothetical protein